MGGVHPPPALYHLKAFLFTRDVQGKPDKGRYVVTLSLPFIICYLNKRLKEFLEILNVVKRRKLIQWLYKNGTEFIKEEKQHTIISKEKLRTKL